MSLRKTFAIIAIGFVLLPFIASAAAPSLWPTGYWGPLVSCTGDYTGTAGATPCRNLCDLVDTAINVIYFAMSIGIFIVAPILFAVGAIMIMVAGANPGMLEQGKKTLTGTLIGIVIILSSYLIINTFIYVIGLSGKVGGFGTSTCSVLP